MKGIWYMQFSTPAGQMHLILWISNAWSTYFCPLALTDITFSFRLSCVRTHLFSKNSRDQHWKPRENMGAAFNWLPFRLESILPQRSISNFCPMEHCCLSHKSNTLRGNTQLFQYYLIYLRDEELKKIWIRDRARTAKHDRCKINSRLCTVSFSSCEMDY